jgi:PAS domain S-box-containing protein
MSTLRFLLLEDKPFDAEAIQAMLTDGGIDYELLRVDTRADFVRALEIKAFDLILAAYALPSFDGIAALEIACNLCPEIPFIFVCASLGEELAIETLKRGATDYVLKQRLGRLVPCVQRALREAKERRELKQAELMLVEQNRLLELIASGQPLDKCLAAVCASVSQLNPRARACFVLTDAQRLTFKRSITPDFPPSFGQGLKDAPINELAIGTCGTAVYCGQPVTCADVANDDRWLQDWRDLCVAHGVLACHSAPVLSVDSLPLGSLMLCFDEARMPTGWERQLANFGTQVASIVFERDRSNLALRQNEARLCAVAANLPNGAAFIVDRDLRYLLAEGNALQGAGITSGYLVGKTLWEALDPTLATRYEPYYRQALGGEPFSLEHCSHDRYYISHGTPLRNERGEVDTVLVVSYDITDRKKVEQERERFLAVGSDLQVITGSNGYFQWVSPTFERVLGWTVDEMTSHPWTDFVHPDDISESVAETDSLFSGNETFAFENRYRHKDGSYRWLLWNAQPYPEEQVIYGAAIDITDSVRVEDERKQVEATLRESEELKQSILESSRDCIKVLTLDSRISYISPGGLCLLEIDDPTSILNTVWADKWQGEDYEKAKAAIAAATMGNTGQFQGYLPTAKGTRKWWDSIITPVRDAAGQVVQLVAISRDITAARCTEVALQESEEQSRNILESITDAFFAVDENWRFTYVNQTAETLVNRSAGDLLGKVFWEEFPGVNDSAFEQMHRRVMQDRVAESLIEFYPDHDRWYEVRSYPAVNGVTMYFRNVTEQIQAEAALREGEKKSRNVLESIAEAFFALDQDWRVTYMNQSGEALLDRPPGDLIGKNFWEEYPGMTGSEFETIYRGAMRDRVPGTLTAFYPDHDRWYDVRTYPAANGITVYFNDVSDLKQAEADLQQTSAELERQLQRFDAITASVPDFIYTFDRSGRFTYSNQQLLNLLQKTSAEVLGKNFFDLEYPIDLATRLQNQIQQVIETHQPLKDETPFTSAFGDHVYEYVFVPLFDVNGAVEAVAGVSRDITDLKRLLQQEQAAREEAERANRIKDEFLAVLSHELRSPLNPILGWTQLLQNGKLDAARRAEALKTIERNARLQSQLIEDLLDISRIMQGKLTLTAAPVSLICVISAAVETVRLAAEAKNIQIALDLDNTIAPISGDAARLQQVVWNLLTNAVKFTPNGGQVTVELRQVDRLAQIRVMDTGKGINPNFVPHVFEYFRQEDGSTTRKFGGLGLGLAIVRQIVEMHGGTVRAESQGENQGATFTVQLPAMQQAAPIVSEPTRTQADTEAPLDNIQILLVDDDTDTREFQAFVLSQDGAKVTAVASGLEALQVLDQFIPDVIVSDVGMAEMDGYMLMQQIRSRPSSQGETIRAIALTAYATEFDQQRAIQAGFQMHITKPLEPEILVSAIVNLLKHNQPS